VAPFDFPVEKGHIITFARSLGEVNPVFYDTLETHGASAPIVAPPTFTQASIRFSPDNPMRPCLGVASERNDGERRTNTGGGTQLHAEQHFEYRRPMVAGETLKVVSRAGATWQKEGRRGGTLTFTETFVDYLDADGEVVITARTVGVVTSQVVEGT
jgi:hypothetical protein